MPVYTEPYSDEILLKNLNKNNGSKSVFVLGCPMCANISCNIYQGAKEPAMNIFLKPLSMEKEIERVKDILRTNNFVVDSHLGRVASLCALNNKQRRKIVEWTNNFDSVIVMSCPAGLSTIVSTLPNKNTISGMILKGFKSVKPKLKGLTFSLKNNYK